MTEVTIALAGDSFVLRIPSPTGASRLVTVPASSGGLTVLRRLLSERHVAADLRIGTPASPTQAQVEAWLRQDRLERAAAAVKKEAAVDQSVLSGINLGDLDL